MLKLVALAIESYQALRKMKKYEGEEINDVAVNEDHGGEENSGVSGESVSETQGDDGQYSDTDGPELTVESEEMNEEEEQEEASARQEHAVKSNEPEGVIGINTEELVGNEEQYVLEKEEQPNEVTQKSKPDVVARVGFPFRMSLSGNAGRWQGKDRQCRWQTQMILSGFSIVSKVPYHLSRCRNYVVVMIG